MLEANEFSLSRNIPMMLCKVKLNFVTFRTEAFIYRQFQFNLVATHLISLPLQLHIWLTFLSIEKLFF